MNMKVSAQYSSDTVFQSYFNIFNSHIHRTGMFWYMALIYLCPLDILRRYFTFLRVESWKVEGTVPESYDKLQEKTKDMILEDMHAFVKDDPLHFVMMIQAMLNFF